MLLEKGQMQLDCPLSTPKIWCQHVFQDILILLPIYMNQFANEVKYSTMKVCVGCMQNQHYSKLDCSINYLYLYWKKPVYISPLLDKSNYQLWATLCQARFKDNTAWFVINFTTRSFDSHEECIMWQPKFTFTVGLLVYHVFLLKYSKHLHSQHLPYHKREDKRIETGEKQCACYHWPCIFILCWTWMLTIALNTISNNLF